MERWLTDRLHHVITLWLETRCDFEAGDFARKSEVARHLNALTKDLDDLLTKHWTQMRKELERKEWK